jgi:spermidine/putrescine transport system substrate-binding protein
MKKLWRYNLIAFAIIALLVNVVSVQAAEKLSIMTWEGYVTDELIAKFEKETGIKVEITFISDNNEMFSKMRATGGTGWDIVSPTSILVKMPQKEFKLFQPIDTSRIKTLGNLEPVLFDTVKKHATIDGKLYALPYVWGTVGVLVNTKYVKKDPISYMDIYDEKYCGRSTTRYRFPTFAAAGYGLGWNYFDNYEDEFIYRNMMNNILQFLVSKKKCIKTYWTTRQENIDLMASEECYISQGWDGTGWLLNKKYPHIKFMPPKEGCLGWVDCMSLAAGAENIDAAYKYFNFVMSPENAGLIIKGGGFSSPVKGATKYLSKEQRKIMEDTYPPEVMANINWYPVHLLHVKEVEAEVEEKLKQAR